jgi:hypothetical protein
MANSQDIGDDPPADSWYRTQAKKQFHEEGLIEIDENAQVSRSEDEPHEGAYVQAWVWIANPDFGNRVN